MYKIHIYAFEWLLQAQVEGYVHKHTFLKTLGTVAQGEIL